ncbi:MAG: hypothetical protein E5X76_21840 [Mesorhizobium sp.]|nr:MAG: hypothetical protein E5X76_21840 [Mesorhizobium sp.]
MPQVTVMKPNRADVPFIRKKEYQVASSTQTGAWSLGLAPPLLSPSDGGKPPMDPLPAPGDISASASRRRDHHTVGRLLQ